MAIYLPFKIIYNNQNLEELGLFCVSHSIKEGHDSLMEICVRTKQYDFNFKDGLLIDTTFPFKNIIHLHFELLNVEVCFVSRFSINYEKRIITLLDNK